MGFGPQGFGDCLRQVLLYLFHGLPIRQPDPSRYPEYMGIDCDYRPVIYHGSYYIGCLAPYSGQLHKVFRIGWHCASEPFQERLCHPDEVPCLVVRKGYRPYESVHLFKGCGGEGLRVGKPREYPRSVHVHPPVGALGGQDYRYQQMEGRVIPEFRLRSRHVPAEPAYDSGISFFSFHSVCLFSGSLSQDVRGLDADVEFSEREVYHLFIGLFRAALVLAYQQPSLVFLADVHVVGHHDDGRAFLLVDASEKLHYPVCRLGVQVAGGLIGNDHFRRVQDGPCDGYPLLFPS